MFEKALILGLYSITPVHAGSGAELSVIDLPIQREKHTGFPVIWGQSLKGVLRNTFRKFELEGKLGSDWKEKAWVYIAGKRETEFKNEDDKNTAKRSVEAYIEKVKQDKRDPPSTEIIFGPSTEAASEHAGAISVGDAKILLFPVRSLKGVFAYITCPMVLNRLKRDLRLINYSTELKLNLTLNVSNDEVVIPHNSKISLRDRDRVVLEDIILSSKKQDLKPLINIISKLSPIDIDAKRVAVVHDDIFSYFVQTSTEVVARVQIDAEKGTVRSGALWYEEYIPSDTLMYSVIAISKPKKVLNGLSTADNIVRELSNFDTKFVQVGGNETVGKGFVRLKVMNNENP